MGSRERYFGTPENSLSENSLLKQGVAVAAAGVLALSLSACKTTNATYPNSGSEISTSVGNGDEAAPGVSYDNDNGKWEKVEATAGTNTDPSIGFAVVDRTLTPCILQIAFDIITQLLRELIEIGRASCRERV